MHVPKPSGGGRPLCCGRTFLSAGLVDHARAVSFDRLVETYAPFAARGVPIVGLEPSCLLTLRDELLSLRTDETAKTISAHALMFEEFLVREAAAGHLCDLPLKPIAEKAVVHGHCHQKSFGAFKPVEQALRLIPGLNVETIESSCCGMAGAFGYGTETYETSIAMAELSLLPAVRRAGADTLVIADEHLLPSSDQGRYRTIRPSRRPRAGDEPFRPTILLLTHKETSCPTSPSTSPARFSTRRACESRREETEAARHHRARRARGA